MAALFFLEFLVWRIFAYIASPGGMKFILQEIFFRHPQRGLILYSFRFHCSGTENSVIKKYLITAQDGKKYNTNHYNLQMVIAVGFQKIKINANEFQDYSPDFVTL